MSGAKNVGQPVGAIPHVELPAPTAWPMVLAFGFTLVFTGLLTDVSVSVLGALLAFAGSIGWFREVFPREHEIAVLMDEREELITTSRQVIERIPLVEAQRAWLPLKTYPMSAGLKGGMAGSVAMAVVACSYGLLHTGSIWYPINLLAAVFYSQSQFLSGGQLNAFHADSFFLAVLLHLLGSSLVGLLYGAMLPMLPRRPVLLGGLIAPMLWSGLLYVVIDLLNPLLGKHINWWWFVVSQIAFGVTAGLVVLRQSQVPTRENLPFVLRAGIEAPGTMSPRERGGQS